MIISILFTGISLWNVFKFVRNKVIHKEKITWHEIINLFITALFLLNIWIIQLQLEIKVAGIVINPYLQSFVTIVALVTLIKLFKQLIPIIRQMKKNSDSIRQTETN